MDEPSPRFRQNLIASTIEAEGVPCVDVRDPDTGTSFRFYDFEYQLALQLNGQPLSDVTAWASATYGVELTSDGLAEFTGRLAELGFLEPRPQPASDTGASDGAAAEVAAASAGAAPAEALEHAEAEWMNVDGAKTQTYVPDASMLDGPADLTPVAPHLPELDTPEPAAARGSGEADKTPIPEPTPVPVRATPAPERAPAPPIIAAAAPARVAAAAKEPARQKEQKEKEGEKEIVRSVAVTRPADAPTVPSLPSNMTAGSRGIGPSAPASLGPPLAAAPPSPSLPSPGLPPPPLGFVPASPGSAAGPASSSGWAAAMDSAFDSRDLRPSPPPSPFGLPPAAGIDPGRGTAGAMPRVTSAPPGLPERRQPPMPEAVVMTDFEEPAAAPAQASRSSPRMVALILVAVLAAAVIGFLLWRSQAPPTPQAVRVRVISPKPTAVYRWFSRPGRVVDHELRALGFAAAGRVAEIAPPGTEFAAGDILARLHGAAALETMLTHHRSRLAYYQQMRESMQAAGNLPELRQAELKYADKQRLVGETLASLAPLVVRAAEPGEVTEALGKVGTFVKSGTSIVRVKGRLLHGELDIEPEEIAAVQEIDFCRVEVIGLGPLASNATPRRGGGAIADSDSPDAQDGPRFVDCQLPAVRPKVPGRLRVALPADLGLVPGQPVRLARHRYEAVFPIPASALNVAGERRTLWVAAPAGLAEERDVTVVEMGDEALVSDGIALHEEVIVEPPAGLRPGMRVAAQR